MEKIPTTSHIALAEISQSCDIPESKVMPDQSRLKTEYTSVLVDHARQQQEIRRKEILLQDIAELVNVQTAALVRGQQEAEGLQDVIASLSETNNTLTDNYNDLLGLLVVVLYLARGK